MIINTDLLKTRKAGNFIAIYGTQENPLSTDYDIMYRDEAEKTASVLRKIAEDIIAEADRLAESASSLEYPIRANASREDAELAMDNGRLEGKSYPAGSGSSPTT